MITDSTTFHSNIYSVSKVHTISNNRFHQGAIIAVIFLTSWLFTGCSTVKSAKLWAPEAFGLVQIAPQIYVEKQLSKVQQKSLLKAIDTARQRIHLYFGSVLSKPEILACATETCYQSLGGMTSKANAYGESKILLSPRGLTAPNIAREWSHIELYTKLDGFFTNSIPQWFDEGLGIVVSNEQTHSEKVWQELHAQGTLCPDLSNLQSENDWLRATKKYGDASFSEAGYNVIYSCAGHEVRRWYRKAGRSGLAHFIETIRFNMTFEQAYAESEGSIKTAQR